MRATQRLLETNNAAVFSDLAPSGQGQMREESERSKLPALDFDPADFFHQITTQRQPMTRPRAATIPPKNRAETDWRT